MDCATERNGGGVSGAKAASRSRKSQGETRPDVAGQRLARLVTGRRPILLLICAVLLLSIAAVYWPVVGHQFVNFDDVGYIIQNPHAQAGLTWDGVKWAFTTGYAANWHPLTWLSHMLDCQLYGLRAGGHHVTSVVLHMANKDRK